MPLPILQSHRAASHDDLVRFYHRTELHWSRHIGEDKTIDVGTAVANPELATVHDANCMRDIRLPEGMSAQDAMAQIDEHFRSSGTQCQSYVVAAGTEIESKRLLDYFAEHDFQNY